MNTNISTSTNNNTNTSTNTSTNTRTNNTSSATIGNRRFRGVATRIVAVCLLAVALLAVAGVQPAEAASPHTSLQIVSTAYIDALNEPVTAGDYVDVYGDGFVPGEIVDIEFGGTVIASVTTDGAGTFLAFGVVDASMPAGAHPLDAIGDLGSWATTDLVVADAGSVTTPMLWPYVGALQLVVEPGGFVEIIGGDFAPGELVTVEFGGSVIDVVAADQYGEFYAAGWIDPLMPPGYHPLDAWGDLGSVAFSDLEVVAPMVTTAIFSWGPAQQGTDALIEGQGFTPYEDVWISFGGISFPVMADEWGTFLTPVFVPADLPAGSHPLEAWGDTGTFAETQQMVEAVAPPVAQQPTPGPVTKSVDRTSTPTETPQVTPATESTVETDDTKSDDTKSDETKSDETKSDETTENTTNVGSGEAESTDDEATDSSESTSDASNESNEFGGSASGRAASADGSAGSAERPEVADGVTDGATSDDGGISLALVGIGGVLIAGAAAGAGALAARRR